MIVIYPMSEANDNIFYCNPRDKHGSFIFSKQNIK